MSAVRSSSVGWFFLCALLTCCGVAYRTHASIDALSVEITCDKTAVRQKEGLYVRISFRNGSSQPVLLYSLFTRGVGGNSDFRIYGDDDRELYSLLLTHAEPFSEEELDPSLFIEIEPGRTFDLEEWVSLEHYDVGPGEFELRFGYRSPLKRETHDGVAVWNEEVGARFASIGFTILAPVRRNLK